MQYVPDSPGVYEAELGRFAEGSYWAELDCPALDPGEIDSPSASAEFSVRQTIPIEQMELAADPGLPRRLAAQTGGVVVRPWESASLHGMFGNNELEHTERRQWLLWDSWPLLGLIVALLTGEWLLRKKVGLT
jgi:hypothetical protein